MRRTKTPNSDHYGKNNYDINIYINNYIFLSKEFTFCSQFIFSKLIQMKISKLVFPGGLELNDIFKFQQQFNLYSETNWIPIGLNLANRVHEEVAEIYRFVTRRIFFFANCREFSDTVGQAILRSMVHLLFYPMQTIKPAFQNIVAKTLPSDETAFAFFGFGSSHGKFFQIQNFTKYVICSLFRYAHSFSNLNEL